MSSASCPKTFFVDVRIPTTEHVAHEFVRFDPSFGLTFTAGFSDFLRHHFSAFSAVRVLRRSSRWLRFFDRVRVVGCSESVAIV